MSDLFEGAYPDPEPPTLEPPISAGRKLTLRLKALAEQGINPLTGTAGPSGETCGGCQHRYFPAGWAVKSYPKCDLGPETSGAATDVRAGWPACHRWEEAKP